MHQTLDSPPGLTVTIGYVQTTSTTDWRLLITGAGFSGGGRRKYPPAFVRARVLERQGGLCLYCDQPFGGTVLRRGRPVRLRLNWDHFVPLAYLAANPGHNWVAACHLCNTMKSYYIFTTVQNVRDHVEGRRRALHIVLPL